MTPEDLIEYDAHAIMVVYGRGRKREAVPYVAFKNLSGDWEAIYEDLAQGADKRTLGKKDIAFWDRGSDVTIIAESPLDAISAAKALEVKYGIRANVLSLNGTAQAEKAIRFLKEKQKANLLVLALDDDKAGHQAAARIREAFHYRTVSLLFAGKDPSEAWKRFRENGFDLALEEAELTNRIHRNWKRIAPQMVQEFVELRQKVLELRPLVETKEREVQGLQWEIRQAGLARAREKLTHAKAKMEAALQGQDRRLESFDEKIEELKQELEWAQVIAKQLRKAAQAEAENGRYVEKRKAARNAEREVWKLKKRLEWLQEKHQEVEAEVEAKKAEIREKIEKVEARIRVIESRIGADPTKVDFRWLPELKKEYQLKRDKLLKLRRELRKAEWRALKLQVLLTQDPSKVLDRKRAKALGLTRALALLQGQSRQKPGYPEDEDEDPWAEHYPRPWK